MADKFDPYREALIVELETIWPEDSNGIDPAKRIEIERALHEHPEEARELEYVRVHTGFCRRITVTDDDLERLA